MRETLRPPRCVLALVVLALAAVVVLAVLAARENDHQDHRPGPVPTPTGILGDTVPMPEPTSFLGGPYSPYDARTAPESGTPYRLTPEAR